MTIHESVAWLALKVVATRKCPAKLALTNCLPSKTLPPSCRKILVSYRKCVGAVQPGKSPDLKIPFVAFDFRRRAHDRNR